jgi:hypothetical protein
VDPKSPEALTAFITGDGEYFTDALRLEGLWEDTPLTNRKDFCTHRHPIETPGVGATAATVSTQRDAFAKALSPSSSAAEVTSGRTSTTPMTRWRGWFGAAWRTSPRPLACPRRRGPRYSERLAGRMVGERGRGGVMAEQAFRLLRRDLTSHTE